MKKDFWLQATKYGIVGIMNTLLTAVTIWIMMHPVFQTGKEENVSPVVITVSNIIGYAVGLINSFVWNRKWTFQSKNHWGGDFIRFVAAFLICYIPQLLLVNVLNTYTRISVEIGPLAISHAYTCQLIGIVFYTALNFLLNKYYTFKPKKM
jgi:putative flippase GtrA